MATPSSQQPPLLPEQRLALEQQARKKQMTRNLAIGGFIFCPIIALMPPRKLDLYTFSLGIGFYLSADHLCELRYERGLVQQLNPMRVGPMSLPTQKARETQRRFAEEREKSRRMLRHGEEEQSILQKVWMGDEKDGWKERRREEEKKALGEGKTFTDIILGQIWEVWNWDQRKKSEQSDAERKNEK